jgi:phosphate/sulfate permease
MMVSAVWAVAICVAGIRDPDRKINFRLLKWILALFVISYTVCGILTKIIDKCPH